MTLTDLRGTPYRIDFTGSDGYHMLSHASRAHFKVRGLGNRQLYSPFADGDPGTDLDAVDLTSPKKGTGWAAMATTALASGAFPIGLAPKVVSGRLWRRQVPRGNAGQPATRGGGDGFRRQGVQARNSIRSQGRRRRCDRQTIPSSTRASP